MSNAWRPFLVGAIGLVLSIGSVGSASATILNFDDLSSSFTAPSPPPYNGFDFTNFYAWDGGSTANYANGVVSSPNFIFSGGQENPPPASPVDIVGTIAADSGTFTFNSVYMTYAYYPGLQVIVDAYNGASLVDTQTVTMNDSNPGPATKFTFDWTNLTSITFQGVAGSGTSDPYSCGTFNCTQFTLDNLEVNDPVPGATPLPATLPLFATGLGALGLLGWRKKRKAAPAPAAAA